MEVHYGKIILFRDHHPTTLVSCFQLSGVLFILAFIHYKTHSYFHMALEIQHNIPLTPLTTIKLGGIAQHYVQCSSTEDIVEALAYAQEHSLAVHILGGGSNTIFPDAGFQGLVIHIQLRGITTQQDGDSVILTAQAGENWDDVVTYTIQNNLQGIECLSGIPGSTGGTPYQNVGAYGQEVAQTITCVVAINRTTRMAQEFSGEECAFAYRTSRFKTTDKDNYIITAVSFRLTPNGTPTLRYPELQQAVGDTVASGKEGLMQVRNAVLALRKKKSMALDANDPNTISCGSFFTNPIVSASAFSDLQQRAGQDVPAYAAGDDFKLSAAWLIEHAGFTKGMKHGNVGISEHHSLALVNAGGTATELLDFARSIQDAVHSTFGIRLEFEPVVV